MEDRPDAAEAEFIERQMPRRLPDGWAEPTRGVRKVYLDQKVWIQLLRDENTSDVRLRLQKAVDHGSVDIILSAAHYSENWHRGGWRSRWNLARLMWDISMLKSISPMEFLLRDEAALVLRDLGFDDADCGRVSQNPFGRGVNHAFHNRTGRLSMVEHWDDSGDGPNISWDALPEELRSICEQGGHVYEWFMLAGTAGDLRGWVNTRTTRLQNDEFVQFEDQTAKHIAGIRSPTMRLYFLAVQDFTIVVEDLEAVRSAARLSVQEILEPFSKPELFLQFVRRFPIVGLFHEFRALKHENPQNKWTGNDRLDLIALSVAAAHCEAVVTERQWVHLYNRTQRSQTSSTRFMSDAKELVDWLDL